MTSSITSSPRYIPFHYSLLLQNHVKMPQIYTSTIPFQFPHVLTTSLPRDYVFCFVFGPHNNKTRKSVYFGNEVHVRRLRKSKYNIYISNTKKPGRTGVPVAEKSCSSPDIEAVGVYMGSQRRDTSVRFFAWQHRVKVEVLCATACHRAYMLLQSKAVDDDGGGAAKEVWWVAL